MDETRLAFEQWWANRVASDDAKAGAWAAWLYLTGKDTIAHQQSAVSKVYGNPLWPTWKP